MTKEQKMEICKKQVAEILDFKAKHPVEFALYRIGAKWDELNAEFEKNGISQNFIDSRKGLKELLKKTIESGVVAKSVLSEYCDSHKDYYIDAKGRKYFDPSTIDPRWRFVKEGYNFNYPSNKR